MTNTTTQVPQAVNYFFTRDLVARNIAMMQYAKFADLSKDIPKKNGVSINWRKYGALSAATTALTEGTTPAGSAVSITDITATAEQYGDFIEYTDVLEMTTLEPALNEFNRMLSEQSAETHDLVVRDILAAGTNVAYANGVAARVNVAANISTTDIKKAVRTLENAKVKKKKSIITGADKHNTSPIAAAYIAIAHPDTKFDLVGLTGFIEVQDYPNQSDVLEGEIGSYSNVRFVMSENAKVWTEAGASDVDVYGTIIFGANAYGITKIGTQSMQAIMKPLGSAGTADPLNQRGSHGWKSFFTAAIINQLNMLRIEHTATV